MTEIATPTPELARVSNATSPRSRPRTRPRSSRCRCTNPCRTLASRLKSDGSSENWFCANAISAATPAVTAIPTASVSNERATSRGARPTTLDRRGGDRQQVRADRHRADDQNRARVYDAVAGDRSGHRHQRQIAADQASVAPARPTTFGPDQARRGCRRSRRPAPRPASTSGCCARPRAPRDGELRGQLRRGPRAPSRLSARLGKPARSAPGGRRRVRTAARQPRPSLGSRRTPRARSCATR